MTMLIINRSRRYTSISFYVASAKMLLVSCVLIFHFLYPDHGEAKADQNKCPDVKDCPDGTYNLYRSGSVGDYRCEPSKPIPNGKLLFADVAEWPSEFNDPDFKPPQQQVPKAATGIPDYRKRCKAGDKNPDDYIASVGLGGAIIVEFTDNSLMDFDDPDLDPDPDLYIFEIGALEPTCVYISEDKINWITIGEINKEREVEIDIGLNSYNKERCDFFKKSKTMKESSDTVKKNVRYKYVLFQDLRTPSNAPGIDIDAVAAIGGSRETQMPNLLGHSESEARDILLQAGLELRPVATSFDPGSERNTIIAQDPPSEKWVPPGTNVGVTIAVASMVPNLFGSRESEAKGLLEKSGLSLGPVHRFISIADLSGVIVGQDPSADSLVAPGHPVNITVVSFVGVSATLALILAVSAAGFVGRRHFRQASDEQPDNLPPGFEARPKPDRGHQEASAEAPDLVLPELRLRGWTDLGRQTIEFQKE